MLTTVNIILHAVILRFAIRYAGNVVKFQHGWAMPSCVLMFTLILRKLRLQKNRAFVFFKLSELRDNNDQRSILAQMTKGVLRICII